MGDSVTPRMTDNRGMPAVTGSRLESRRRRLFRGSDLREAFLVALSAFTAKMRPADRWTVVADRMQILERSRGSKGYRKFRERAAAFFGPDVADNFVDNLWQAYRAGHHRRRMLIVAERLGDFRPAIEFVGQESIERALAKGNGVILWYDNFRHHPIVGKRPIAEAGYRNLHLSSSDHGFSRSVVGQRFLNPIQISAENNYLERRVVFDSASTLSATRAVRDHLAKNGVVQINNNAYIGRRVISLPIGASAWLAIATTPMNFALKYNAPLLPVSVIEKVPFQEYRVAVGPEIVVDNAPDRNLAFEIAARRYVEYLEPVVRSHPEQWLSWMAPIEEQPTHAAEVR